MKYVSLLLLGLLVACGSSNSTPTDVVPDPQEKAPETETGGGTETEGETGGSTEPPDSNGTGETEGSTQTPNSNGTIPQTSGTGTTGMMDCGFWCDRPTVVNILEEQTGYNSTDERWHLAGALPIETYLRGEYHGDIEIDGDQYSDDAIYRNPRIKLIATLGRNPEIVGEISGQPVTGLDQNEDEVLADRELIARSRGDLNENGTFDTFDNKGDPTGMSGAFFGDVGHYNNHGIAGIVGTLHFKGTFITDHY